MRAARTATALLTAAVLATGAAGCGGSDTGYREVPGPPATVPIPDDASTIGSGGDADADATTTPDADATATPDAGAAAPEDQSGATDTGTNTGAATDTGGTDAAGTDSGGTTAPAQEDGPASDSPPPAGSEAQQFEDFCAQNPGAC